MGKYSQYRLFRRDPLIRKHLPATALCRTPSALDAFLNKYASVYIKPAGGMKGIGVVKAWREGAGLLYVIERGQPARCSSAHELYGRLGLRARPAHIVQQDLQLATVHGRPFDVRIMMLRDTRKRWTYAGMLAKVAGADSVITNVNRGKGYVLPVDAALRQGLQLEGTRAAALKAEMIRLASRCNRVFDRFRYEWQMGYDIGIDRTGRIWLIEANPSIPSHALFRKLPDPAMYRNIKRMDAAYRRVIGNRSPSIKRSSNNNLI